MPDESPQTASLPETSSTGRLAEEHPRLIASSHGSFPIASSMLGPDSTKRDEGMCLERAADHSSGRAEVPWQEHDERIHGAITLHIPPGDIRMPVRV